MEYRGISTIISTNQHKNTVKVKVEKGLCITHTRTHKIKIDDNSDLLLINAYLLTRGGKRGYNQRFGEALWEIQSHTKARVMRARGATLSNHKQRYSHQGNETNYLRRVS